MNKIYDLHSHSTASDGVLTPTELVQRASEQNVSVLALTDHDSVNGLDEAHCEAKKQNIELINGVEISTVWENRSIHIVGLNFDKTHENITALLQQQADNRAQRAVQIAEKLQKVGIPNAYEGAKQFAKGEITRAHYARFLVQQGYVKDENQAFKKYLAQGKSCYVKSAWVDIPTAVDCIHQAGGLAVLAHPLRYELTARKLKTLINDFKNWHGDAMEAAGCGQSPDQRQWLIRLLGEYELLASVGSDFHFPCGWVELGKSLYLPETVEKVWDRF